MFNTKFTNRQEPSWSECEKYFNNSCGRSFRIYVMGIYLRTDWLELLQISSYPFIVQLQSCKSVSFFSAAKLCEALLLVLMLYLSCKLVSGAGVQFSSNYEHWTVLYIELLKLSHVVGACVDAIGLLPYVPIHQIFQVIREERPLISMYPLFDTRVPLKVSPKVPWNHPYA